MFLLGKEQWAIKLPPVMAIRKSFISEETLIHASVGKRRRYPFLSWQRGCQVHPYYLLLLTGGKQASF